MADIDEHPAAVERELEPQLWSTQQPWFAERLAALQADPENDQRALAYAALLERRGMSELDRGSLSESLSLLATARETLEPRLSGAEGEAAASGLAAELRAGLHRVLLVEARAFERPSLPTAADESGNTPGATREPRAYQDIGQASVVIGWQYQRW